MAPPASSIITRVAYGISQLPRVAWYLGHGLALRRLSEAARRSNGAKARRRVRTSAPVPNRSRLYVTRLFLQGLANVEAAFIPFPPIMTDRCSRSLIDPRLFFEDLPEIHRRRERQRHNEVFNKDTRDTRPPFRGANDQPARHSSGSFARAPASCRASSRVNTVVADRRRCSSLK